MNGSTISYWNKTAPKTEYPRLDTNVETDILIIGSGITGVTCAYCLAQRGIPSVVIEAGGLCDGTTGNTTGKLTIGHGVIYDPLIQKHGQEFARLYAESQAGALEFIRQQVRNHSINCQLATCTNFVYASRESDKEIIEKEYEAVIKLGLDAELIIAPSFPEQNYGMVGIKNQAVFHPVRYVDALAGAATAMGARIYCSTKATKVEDGDVISVRCENSITIKAKHLVMATQYPIYDGPNIFYTRLFAKRSYGIAVRAKRDWPSGNYVNVGDPSRSVRTHVEGDRRVLIVVGENHPTGRDEEGMEAHYGNLIKFAESAAGVEELLAKWSAQDYDTPDQAPYIGRISAGSNIYAAAGFGKWGLTNGTLAGNMIASLIADGHCRYEELYARERADYFKGFGKAVSEVFGSVGELIKSKLENVESVRDLKPGEGRVILYKGQKAGIYRDFDDSATILDITCTHMSTVLNFNAAEKTWDCPAHGGRYNTDGRLLEGPPKDNLKVLFRGRFCDVCLMD